jgi:hypothetical protein
MPADIKAAFPGGRPGGNVTGFANLEPSLATALPA